MEQFIVLLNLLKEFTENVYPDYDRETVLVELPQQYYQDLLLKLEKINVDVIYKQVKKDNYLLVIGIYEDED
jgi:hypothetical protein